MCRWVSQAVGQAAPGGGCSRRRSPTSEFIATTVRDNTIEPENHGHNLHACHNVNVSAFAVSLDSCRGGPMFFYGNTGRFDGGDSGLRRVGGERLVEGPPFPVTIPDGGLDYEERPRVTRCGWREGW